MNIGKMTEVPVAMLSILALVIEVQLLSECTFKLLRKERAPTSDRVCVNETKRMPTSGKRTQELRTHLKYPGKSKLGVHPLNQL